jgi:hypothetical protein
MSNDVTIRPDDGSTLAIWRVGIVAYRNAALAGFGYHRCELIGIEAVLEAYPEMDLDAARSHMTRALAWVTGSEHAKWFRRGTPRYEYIWPKDERGVGHNRWVNGRLVYAGEAGETPIGYSGDE